MHSSDSKRAASRSRRTSRTRCRRSRSSGSRTAPARRQRSGSAAASVRRAASGRTADHGQPRAGRAAQGGLGVRPADRARRARGVGSDPARRARAARGARRARARRAGPSGRRRLRGRGGRAPAGLARLVCAAQSAPEAALAGIEPVPVRHLAEAVAYLRGELRAEPQPAAGTGRSRRRRPTSPTSVARSGRAARSRSPRPGGHNLLFGGPPGTGKTMLARRLPGILPPLDDAAALEVTRIHSVAGSSRARAAARRDAAVSRAAPHRLGGGDRRRRRAGRGRARRASPITACCCSTSCPSSPARAGGAASAARGRRGRVARVEGRRSSRRVPARRDDELCPCGARGDPAVACTCSPQRLAAYGDKLSRALLDRFDSWSWCPRPRAVELAGGKSEASAASASGSLAARWRLADADAVTETRGRCVAHAGGRAPPALGARTGPCRARGGDDRRARGGRRDRGAEHVAEALSYRVAERAESP